MNSIRCTRPLALALLSFAACGPTLADPPATAWVETQVWTFAVDGQVHENGDTLDLRDDLAVRRRRSPGVELGWAPGWGWLHQATLTYQGGAASGNADVDRSLTFGPLTLLPETSQTHTQASFDDWTLGGRYRVDHGGVEWFAGVALTYLRGSVRIEDLSDGETSFRRTDAWFPLLHVGAELPLGQLAALQLAGAGIRGSGESVSQWRARLRLDLWSPLHLAVGFAQRRYAVNAGDDYRIDTRLRGLHASLGLSW